jgi:hypothetical protein
VFYACHASKIAVSGLVFSTFMALDGGEYESAISLSYSSSLRMTDCDRRLPRPIPHNPAPSIGSRTLVEILAQANEDSPGHVAVRIAGNDHTLKYNNRVGAIQDQ